MSSPEPNDEKLERFARALRNAEESRRVFVPPTMDEAILKQARERLEGKAKRPPFRFWNWMALAGAAALIVILIFILPRTKPAVIAREDINGDGQVDILKPSRSRSRWKAAKASIKTAMASWMTQMCRRLLRWRCDWIGSHENACLHPGVLGGDDGGFSSDPICGDGFGD
jgi:hypothetical protein